MPLWTYGIAHFYPPLNSTQNVTLITWLLMELWAVGQRVLHITLLSSHCIIFLNYYYVLKKEKCRWRWRQKYPHQWLSFNFAPHTPQDENITCSDLRGRSGFLQSLGWNPLYCHFPSSPWSCTWRDESDISPESGSRSTLYFRELHLTANYSFCIPPSPFWRVPIHSVQMVNINGKWAASS